MPKYSEVKEKLNIEVTRPEQIDLAYLTHYLQNAENGVAHYYERPAAEYLKKHLGKDNQKPSFREFLPVKWDVPFAAPKSPKFKFIDLFAGIGGFRLAFQNLGGKSVFTSEWNYFAQKTYEANFGEVPFGDITKIPVKEIPEHDILLAGFPCQPFSIAGVSKKNSLGRAHGFLDEIQGNLFFNIAKILEVKKPKAFMLENVKNLVSHDKKNTFKVIHDTLLKLGYSVHFKVMDAKDLVPQHRERIFIVGFRKDIYKEKEKFEFPKIKSKPQAIEDILEKKADLKYTLTDHLWSYLQKYSAKHKEKGNGFGFGLVNLDGISRTLSARYYKDGSEILIPQNHKNPRRLTPRECARLQGFPDKFIIPVSDTQAYKQFGNSVCMPLIERIGKEIVKLL